MTSQEPRIKVGIGLPAGIPGVTGDALIAWAKKSDDAGFSSLAVIDRLAYANQEPLAVLAAAAAVTRTARLATTVLLGPQRINAALLAKQTATIDSNSRGSLMLGIAVGGRPDDFELSAADFHRRGANLERQLAEMKEIWNSNGPIGPRPARAGGPELIAGGHSDAAIARGARLADGWIAGAGGIEGFRAGAEILKAAWQAAGRKGNPRLLGLTYFGLGPGADDFVGDYITDYYGEFGSRLLPQIPRTADKARQMVASYHAAGCDELILLPCSDDVGQVEQLAEAVL